MPRTSLRTQASLFLLLSLLGCAAPSARVLDTGGADAGIPDAGMPDAGPPDGGRAKTDDPAAGQATCEQELTVIQRSVNEGRLAEAVVLARLRESRCPRGELLSARLLILQGRADDAAGLLVHQVMSPSASPIAFEMLVRLFPRLSPQVQQQVADLGASLKTAIPVLTIRQTNDWITQVVCRGNRLDRLDLRERYAPGRGSVGFVGWLKDSPKRISIWRELLPA